MNSQRRRARVSTRRSLRGALGFALLLIPVAVQAAPTLDSDGRIISVDVEPPFSTMAQTSQPGAFAPFDQLVTQGGSQPCGGVPSNASSSAAQDSTVSPLAFAGTGSTSYSIEAGDCSGASADVRTIYEVTFTTDGDYEFDFDATLTNASARLENDAGSTLFSWTAHTGVVSDLQMLPADVYTLRVDAAFVDFLSPVSSSSDSGGFDFTLALTPPSAVPGIGPVGAFALLASLAGLGLRASRSDMVARKHELPFGHRRSARF